MTTWDGATEQVQAAMSDMRHRSHSSLPSDSHTHTQSGTQTHTQANVWIHWRLSSGGAHPGSWLGQWWSKPAQQQQGRGPSVASPGGRGGD